jgi:hypothetical protein
MSEPLHAWHGENQEPRPDLIPDKWKPATGTGTAPDIQPPGRPGKNRDNPRHPNGRRP